MSGNVLSLLTQSRWAMKREALDQLVAIAEAHLGPYLPGGARADSAADAPPVDPDDRLRRRRALFAAPATEHPDSPRLGVRDGVAIVPVVGPLCRYASWIQEVCGLTSYQLVAQDLRIAVEDPGIRAILLHLDTPGGEVDGCAELAAQIHRSRGRKPIVAMVSDGAASAGYWLAAACDEIVVSPAAYVGSIGVWFEIWDASEREQREGFRRFQIVSPQSPNKVPDPASDAGHAQLVREAGQFADAFLEAVASYRGTTAEALIAAGDGGAVFIGRHAVARGLADRVGTSEELLAELAARSPAAARPTATTTPESAMPSKARSRTAAPQGATVRALAEGDEVTCRVTREVRFTEGATVTVLEVREGVTALAVREGEEEKRWLLADEVEGGSVAPAAPAEAEGGEDEDDLEDAPAAVRAAYPQAAAALVAEGVALGVTQGASAERARIQGILALPGATAQPAVLQACLDDPACTRAQAAERLLASQPVAGRAALEAMLAAEHAGAPAPTGGGGADATGDAFVERVLAARTLVRGTP